MMLRPSSRCLDVRWCNIKMKDERCKVDAKKWSVTTDKTFWHPSSGTGNRPSLSPPRFAGGIHLSLPKVQLQTYSDLVYYACICITSNPTSLYRAQRQL